MRVSRRFSKYEPETDKILILFRSFELSIIILLLITHTKTEFVVPSLGYGTQGEVAAMMTVYSGMIIPVALRLQSSIARPGVGKVADCVFLFIGFLTYLIASAVTIQSWLMTQKVHAVIFRRFFTEILLIKGIASIFLSAGFCVEAYFVLMSEEV